MNVNSSYNYKSLINYDKISILEDKETFEKHFEEIKILADYYKLIGLDLEWSQNRSVDLIQIAFPNMQTFLIRLDQLQIDDDFEDNYLTKIGDILSDESYLKFGRGIYDDAIKMKQDYGIKILFFIDLACLAHEINVSLSKDGLKTLALELLNIDYKFEIGNNHEMVPRKSWNCQKLTGEQIRYASLDAQIGCLIALKYLVDMRRLTFFDVQEFSSKKIDVAHLPPLELDNLFLNHCFNRIEMKFIKDKRFNKMIKQKNIHLQISREKKRPIFENYMLKFGSNLIIINGKESIKLFLKNKKNLKISETNMDGFPVKCLEINFYNIFNSFFDVQNDEFYKHPRKNICAVCGSPKGATKHVIPPSYSKNFPKQFRMSHDVLQLCAMHHTESSKFLQILKSRFQRLYNLTENFEENFGKQVVDCLKTDAAMANTKIFEFIVMCRVSFLKTMKPCHMPIGWDVNHNQHILLRKN